MITGSCLCGAVRFEIQSELGPSSNCHCAMCRKMHGAAFGTYVRVNRSDMKYVSGEDHVATYKSSAAVTRSFCRTCGSPFLYARDGRDNVAVAVGVLDGDPGTKPVMHIFVASKAPWNEIADALPQHQEFPR